MKRRLSEILNKTLLLGLLLTSMVFIVSCSKDEQQPLEVAETAMMKVSVAGIEGSDIVVSHPIGKTARSKSTSTDEKIVKFADFDVATSFIEDGYGEAISAKAASTSSGKKANTSMNPGVKYRLLLYLANGQFSKSVEITAGTPMLIPVKSGQKYTWIAYSYNTSDAVTDVVNYANPSIPTSVTKELLYANGQITISSVIGANDLLPITFKRKLGRVGVEINAGGIFAKDITQAVISFQDTYFKEGTFNLKTGLVSNFTAPTVQTTLTGTAPESYIRTLYYYTADTATAIADLRVKLESIKLKNDRGVEKSYTVNAVFSNIGANGIGFIPATGTSHKAAINILQSGIPMGSTIWAPANLYYDALAAVGYRYKFRSEPSNIFNTTTVITEMNKEYWQWMPDGLVPYSPSYQPTNSGPHKDPCLQVYPAGTWRMPTSAEFQSLVSNASASGGVNSTARNRYITFSQAGKSVTFPTLGYRQNGNSATITDWNSQSTYRAIGYYWSSTPETSNDAYYLEIDQTNISNASNFSLDVPENLDVENGATVRCVKK